MEAFGSAGSSDSLGRKTIAPGRGVGGVTAMSRQLAGRLLREGSEATCEAIPPWRVPCSQALDGG
jgi:hypothetical protein